jgi:hypothetical protein
VGRRGQRFGSKPFRCPSCRPIAEKVTRPDGAKTGWQPEATYVGFLRTDAYEGYKKAPATCPECGSDLVAAG